MGQVGTHTVTFDAMAADGGSASFTVRYTIFGEFWLCVYVCNTYNLYTACGTCICACIDYMALSWVGGLF